MMRTETQHTIRNDVIFCGPKMYFWMKLQTSFLLQYFLNAVHTGENRNVTFSQDKYRIFKKHETVYIFLNRNK